MAVSDFKVKFDGDNHLDANVLINSLIHTTTLIHEINRYLNPSRQIQVKVKAPEKSSFLIEIQVLDVLDVISRIKQLATASNIETTGHIVLMHIPEYTLPPFRCKPYHLFRSKVYHHSGPNLTSNSARKFTSCFV